MLRHHAALCIPDMRVNWTERWLSLQGECWSTATWSAALEFMDDRHISKKSYIDLKFPGSFRKTPQDLLSTHHSHVVQYLQNHKQITAGSKAIIKELSHNERIDHFLRVWTEPNSSSLLNAWQVLCMPVLG